MRFPVLAVAALTVLAACDVPPSDAITLSPEAMARADTLDPSMIAPSVSPQVAVSTFDQYCGRFPANPAGTRRAVEASGYFLFVSGTSDGLDMFASDDGRPMVATGRRDGAEVCMVLMQENRGLGRAVDSYVQQKHGAQATNIGTMPTPEGDAENVWVVPTTLPRFYFTLVQQQPGLGRVQAFAQVTE